ncbi:hypothetical protein MWN34_09070 [Ancylobacter sp. 6x-1]|uniref:Bro-N domain-containing protein n=1 Tax=Ancylobacter crimeensis TaxID=2579147 RepID=A0ABT0DAU5_9HYPH|nr:hypothetical protein [Ancylobacter crimeensis]MCK0197062.1 hypothetical protein [Ancylobacter crimeensis]
MSNLTTYTFGTHTIRVVTIDREPWFVAADVCHALDAYLGPRSGRPNVTAAKGHAGEPLNEAADAMAKAEAHRQQAMGSIVGAP